MIRNSHSRKMKVKMDNYVRDKEALTINNICNSPVFDEYLILRITSLQVQKKFIYTQQ